VEASQFARHLSEVTPPAEQDAPPTGIEGVKLARLSGFEDHRGALTEVFNPEMNFWVEPIVYSYFITIRPGRIKGWGMHRVQADRYFVLGGSVRVVLYDGRVKSPSYEQFAQFHFTESTRGLLHIPQGVWHADQNWGDTDALIINFPTEPFNRQNPDKYRIDPHSGEIPFDWSLRDG
jgi:dTDP-4-dehydrorhamnose 3,5-epimerase